MATWLPTFPLAPSKVSFTFPTLLTLGLPLIGLPLLIHLINLRRHRRVEWAAMEFLLQSQKRNKKWIFLRQLLLLLCRTAAIAFLVFMLAGPVATSAWARFVGRGITHHLILLDDSYSMGDRWEPTTALAEATRAVTAILEEAQSRQERQLVTLLRFSEAERLTAGAGPEVDRQQLDDGRLAELAAWLTALEPAESAAGPIEALAAAARLPEPPDDETRIAYVVSDFRRAQWDETVQLEQLVGGLRSQVEQLQMIQCVDATRANLAITQLAPESGIRAAGVECWMEVTVANYSDVAAPALVEIEQDGARLPAVEFDPIPPGEEATRRFRATFVNAGPHVLEARLEGDALSVDNVFHYAANVPEVLPVLIIDGSARGDDGVYLRTALSPGGKNLAGWSPQIERPAFLRRHEQLADYPAIVLLDVPRLDLPEVEALEQYVRDGGGLGLFVGPRVLPAFYNEFFYRDGEGLLPAPWDVPTQLLRTSDEEGIADVAVSDDPLFRVFRGRRNSFLAVANVNFYYAIEPGWQPAEAVDVRVLATLRNGAPLVMEKDFGEGRVVVQLCKLSPQPTDLGSWSNWGVNPVFPVYANELVGRLSAARRSYRSLTSGDVLQLRLPEAEFEPEVRIVPPGDARVAATVLAKADGGQYLIEAPGPADSGVWRIELQPRNGPSQQRVVAVNIPRGDGDLHHLDRDALKTKLPNVDYEFRLAGQLSSGEQQLAGFRLSDAALYGLLIALLIEQWLAVQASYHRAAPRSTT